jgi:hypothetical protein
MMNERLQKQRHEQRQHFKRTPAAAADAEHYPTEAPETAAAAVLASTMTNGE